MLYLLLMTKFKACTQIEQQTTAFVEGVGDIIPVQWLQVGSSIWQLDAFSPLSCSVRKN